MNIKRIMAAMLCGVFCGGAAYVFLWGQRDKDIPAPIPENAIPTNESTIPEVNGSKDAKRTGEMRENVASIFEGKASYSLFFSCMRGQKCDLLIHESVSMRSASMIKVFILSYAMERVKDGALDLQESVRLRNEDKVGGSGVLMGYPTGTELSVLDLLRLMITESDNTATNLMIDRLGMDSINHYIAGQGYSETVLQRKMMDFEAAARGRENYTTARDLGTFFTRLYHHQCVSPQYDTLMVEIFKAQTDDEVFPAALPDTMIAHKTGELIGAYHDGGIVYGDKDYVLVILTDDYNNRDEIVDVIRKTARYLLYSL